jgi:hypothetical protein
MDRTEFSVLVQDVRTSGKQRMARCPAHADRQPSLSVGVGDDGRILLKCHAGCEVHALCERTNMAAKLSDPDRDQAARVVALFSVLIHGWQTNDFAEAARARAELEQLGVKVRLPGRRSRRQAMKHA